MTSPAHLPTTVLDGYLHHTLPPTNHQQIRRHLDRCEPCWRAWNRHRWDAARLSQLYAQLAEFLSADFRPYFDSSRALAAEWDAANPCTDHDIAQFFRTSTSYLYNLAIWDASGNRPDYLTHALPSLARHGTRTVLDYGCGIGSDTLPLHHRGFDVVGCDFHSPSTAFLRWRSGSAIPVIEPGELGSINEPDTLWIIDTLDHLIDIETSLGAILPVVDLVVTENLTTNRAHGRQRFHYRRPFPEITALFARHGLIPSVATAGTPIMCWTFPSGAQEAGEVYADTAARETLEETGLAVIAHDQIGERTHPKTGRHMVYVAADPVNGTAVRVGDPDEHSEVGWYPWATAEGMLPHLFEPVADHLRATLPT